MALASPFTGRSGSDTAFGKALPGFALGFALGLEPGFAVRAARFRLASRVIVFQRLRCDRYSDAIQHFRYVDISVALGFQLGDALGIGLDIGLGRRSASNSDWGCLRPILKLSPSLGCIVFRARLHRLLSSGCIRVAIIR